MKISFKKSVSLLGIFAYSSSSFLMVVSGFSSTNIVISKPVERHFQTRIYATDDNESSETATTTTTSTIATKPDLYIPLSLDEMVKQTSAAMEDAKAQGKNRQIIRILLPRSSDNDQLLQYYESNVVSEDGTATNLDVKLCPTDESWQGGIMQLYRAASLACQEILRYVDFIWGD
jgi:hypothetical protein